MPGQLKVRGDEPRSVITESPTSDSTVGLGDVALQHQPQMRPQSVGRVSGGHLHDDVGTVTGPPGSRSTAAFASVRCCA